MEEQISFPIAFYLSFGLLIAGLAYSWKIRDSGLGIPMGAVLGTVGIWYFGDALYNDYEIYTLKIGP